MTERVPAYLDDDVTRRIKELRYLAIRLGQPCGIQAKTGSTDCWCQGQGKDKKSLPCPIENMDLPSKTTEIPL